MITKTISSINFVFRHATQKNHLIFWFFIRFISATLPLITIYQFSHIIKLAESHADLSTLIYYLILIFVVRLVDNFLRIRSITNLDFLISNLSFDIHNYFLINFSPETKEERHASIQAIRNFADATIKTLTLLVQPGIDSIVSIIFIPIAMSFIDLRDFILVVAYILIYLAINYFFNQRYKELRDFQNSKTETYYAKFQESNDIDLEQNTYTRHYRRLTNWNFSEWFTLQNSAVFFYSLLLFYQIYQVYLGQQDISDLVLVMGYTTQTQTFLNSFTDILHCLGDMYVALKHLARNESVSVLSLEELT